MESIDQHVWVASIHDNVVRLGLTKLLLSQVGKILHVDLPSVGAICKKDEMFVVVESSKSAIEIQSPVTGEVLQVNDAVLNSIELLNDSPEGDGWLMIVKLDRG